MKKYWIGCIAALASGAAAPALAASSITVANGWAPGHVVSTAGVEPWMKCVEDSAANVEFNYFPSGQIASTQEMLESINNGVADAAIIPMGYVTSKMPLNGVSLLPNLGSKASTVTPAYAEAVKSGPIGREFAENGVHPLWVIVFPSYQLASRVGPLKSIDDFSGKVIRSSGGAMNLTVSSLGSSAAEIPSSDLYVSLERGAVDAALSALASIKPYNIQEVVDAVTTNGEFGSFSLSFAISAETWEGLDAETRTAMTDCGSQVQASFADRLDEETEQLAAEFEQDGVTVYEFSPEELAAIKEKTSKVSDEWVSRLKGQGLPAKEVLDSYSALVSGE